MTFSYWKHWVKRIPITQKWFILLILFRPLIDNFYYLKEVSPFLSPLYWVGILTPFLCLIGIIKFKKISSTADRYFYWWSISIFSSVLFISINNNESLLIFFAAVFKIVTPIFLFLFLRSFIRNRRDLEGILYTFYLSFFLVLGLLVYEIFFGPIRVTYRSEGVERIQGNFGDVASYGLNISLALLVIFYFQLKKIYSKMNSISKYQTILIFIIILLALPKLNHATTTICLMIIVLLYTYHFGRRRFGYVLVFLLIIGSILLLYWDRIYGDFVERLYGKEINILLGEGNENQLLHGRFGRLKMLFNLWVDYPLVDKLFGTVISKLQYWMILVSGTHNDFIRILMLGGLFGLTGYLLFLLSIINKVSKYSRELKFLGTGALVLLFLYSITLTPTLYPNFMYIILSIFAYFSLPHNYNQFFENSYNIPNIGKKQNYFSRQITPPIYRSGNSSTNNT